MNIICYCGDLLKVSTWDRDDSDGYRCDSCCKEIKTKYDNRVFLCKENDECIFASVSGGPYRVCPDCYDGYNNPPSTPISDEKKDHEEETLICKKFIQNLDIVG